MKCTNCGNANPATHWDEGDTIYCSVCTHSTRKTDFEGDSVQCPYCHRLRDKKAMYCNLKDDKEEYIKALVETRENEDLSIFRNFMSQSQSTWNISV